MEKEDIKELAPIISERRVINIKNLTLSFIIGIILIFSFMFAIFFFNFDTLNSVMLASLLIIIYAIILFFLLEPSFLREITRTTIKTIKEPMIIEKPVQVMHETEKTIYVTNPRKNLNIPKYEYQGSTETRTYHKKSCRLGKLIKKKYKLQSNDPSFFTKKGFKPCKVCIRHLRKA